MNTKEVLKALLRHRGIHCYIFYDKHYHQWMFSLQGLEPSFLMGDTVQAIEMITGGHLNFLKENKDQAKLVKLDPEEEFRRDLNGEFYE